MSINDSLISAISSLRSHALRSFITMSIIALGLMALIGIITSIKIINNKFSENFSGMGSASFTIQYQPVQSLNKRANVPEYNLTKQGKSGQRFDEFISFNQAQDFCKAFKSSSLRCISIFAGRNFAASFYRSSTQANVTAIGIDENYLQVQGYQIAVGRNFTAGEARSASPVCIIGQYLVQKLFRNNEANALNRQIKIDGIRYTVAAVLNKRGTAFGINWDNIVFFTNGYVAQHFQIPKNFSISVVPVHAAAIEEEIVHAEVLFKNLRQMPEGEKDNFSIIRNNFVADRAQKVLHYLFIASIAIGLITVAGSAIGLVNIMFVSVSERTREIGLKKALGASRREIIFSFLLEPLLLSIAGALAGILLGIIVGNFIAIVLKASFLMPWDWLFFGLMISGLVGIVSGIFPALKAGNLQPIKALRHE